MALNKITPFSDMLIGLTSGPSATPLPRTPASAPSTVSLTIAQLCTTAAIGIVGYCLSRIQVKNTQFKPEAIAIAEQDAANADAFARIAVRVSNGGGASGMIRRIDIRYGPNLIQSRRTIYVGWGAGSPLPFYLPGRAAAEIIIAPRITGEAFLKTDHIVLAYGLNEEERVKIAEILSDSHISGATILPPGSLPVVASSPDEPKRVARHFLRIRPRGGVGRR